MGPIWGRRTQMGPMLAPWTLLSWKIFIVVSTGCDYVYVYSNKLPYLHLVTFDFIFVCLVKGKLYVIICLMLSHRVLATLAHVWVSEVFQHWGLKGTSHYLNQCWSCTRKWCLKSLFSVLPCTILNRRKCVNTLRPELYGWHFANANIKSKLLNPK